MVHVKKGDVVEVLSGFYRDARGQEVRTGRVLRVFPKSGEVLVEGINLVYRHLKPSKKSPQGGRVQREARLPLCKVLPVDPRTGKGARVRHVSVEVEGKTKKQRMTVGRVERDATGKALRNPDGSLKRAAATAL